MNEVVCKEMIVSTLSRRGTGSNHSPIRVIREVFEKDGTKIAEHDPCPETFTQMDLLHFARWMEENGYDPHKSDSMAVLRWLDDVKNINSSR